MHEEHRQRLRRCVIEAKGETDGALREKVFAFSAERSGGPKDGVELPGEALPGFVDTVARHAYESTVDQVEALRTEGYGDDAIYEITVLTAVSAGITRLDRALAALKEEA